MLRLIRGQGTLIKGGWGTIANYLIPSTHTLEFNYSEPSWSPAGFLLVPENRQKGIPEKHCCYSKRTFWNVSSADYTQQLILIMRGGTERRGSGWLGYWLVYYTHTFSLCEIQIHFLNREVDIKGCNLLSEDEEVFNQEQASVLLPL